MSVKIKTVKDEFPKVKATLDGFAGKKVNVGVLRGEHQYLAGIHEYGCRVPVTPKMRAYLHHRGIHLKASTTEIIIPERSFLRGGYDANQKDIDEQASRAVGIALDGTLTAQEALETVGDIVAGMIYEYADKLKSPPNSAWTIRDKGSSNPLVDSSELISGITYELEG